MLSQQQQHRTLSSLNHTAVAVTGSVAAAITSSSSSSSAHHSSLPTAGHAVHHHHHPAAVVTTTRSVDLRQWATDAFFVGGFFAFVALVSFAAIRDGSWRYYLAGGICASTSHALTTPIDVVKTRQQVSPELANQPLLKATRTIIKDNGPSVLLAGLGPTTFGYLFEGAIKFGIYEVLKPPLITLFASLSSSTLLPYIVCGAISGVAASALLCPMEALRIRLVAEPELGEKGWIYAGGRMVRREGWCGLWKGISAMMAKQVPYTVTKQVTFDVLTKWGYGVVGAAGVAMRGGGPGAVGFVVPLISAIVASLLSCVSSQPGDMLLSVVNAHEGTKSARGHAKEIMRGDGGWRGFFVGTRARLLHVGIIVTMQLLIYDFVKRLCGIPATGSC